LSILLLAKNEAENLRVLVPKLKSILNKSTLRYEIIVVDAGSNDGTEPFCVENGARFMIQTNPGFGAALGQGLRACRGRRVLTMDADLQHDPTMIPKLLRTDADIVIGSRWIGGFDIGLSFPRKVLSLTLNAVFSRCIGGNIKDTSSNFRVYKRHILDDIEIEARDFDAMQEILAKCTKRGCTVAEIPVPFTERHIGHSSISFPLFFLSYAQTFIRVLRIRLTYPH